MDSWGTTPPTTHCSEFPTAAGPFGRPSSTRVNVNTGGAIKVNLFGDCQVGEGQITKEEFAAMTSVN